VQIERERQRITSHSRLLTIARLPSLVELEGTVVTPAEREDAERFWIEQSTSEVVQVAASSDWARRRLEELQKSAFPPLLLDS
jgi:hypothetical protein